MKIVGLQKLTLLDYPGRVACTVFLGGCNFRCPFCHNGQLLENAPAVMSEQALLTFLKGRQGILDGVCITGGEPTLSSELPGLLRQIKELGYLVKLDTNGYRPEVLSDLLDKKLLDYIAMDIKSGYSNYAKVSGISNFCIDNIKKSISLIENSGISYDFRTTVVKELHSEKDFEEITSMLSSNSPYFLQSFKISNNVLTPGLSSCDKETLNHYLSIMKEKITATLLRGID